MRIGPTRDWSSYITERAPADSPHMSPSIASANWRWDGGHHARAATQQRLDPAGRHRAVQRVPGPPVVRRGGLEPAERGRGHPVGAGVELKAGEVPLQGPRRGRRPGMRGSACRVEGTSASNPSARQARIHRSRVTPAPSRPGVSAPRRSGGARHRWPCPATPPRSPPLSPRGARATSRAAAHPHRTGTQAHRSATGVRPRPNRYLPSTPGASEHQVTALLLAKAWEGRRASPEHGHALVANHRGPPKPHDNHHIVVPGDADPSLPTRGQPRCRSTRSQIT